MDFTAANILLVGLAFGLLAVLEFARYARERRKMVRLLDKIPGPNPRFPIVGVVKNYLLYRLALYKSPKQMDTYVLIWQEFLALCKCYASVGICKFYLGHQPFVHLCKPEMLEPVMTSWSVVDKSPLYRMLEPWIGEGLVTSRQKKWRSRRKIITPAFHFKILTDFLPIMDRGSGKFVRTMNHKRNQWIQITPAVSLCTLDIICQTAMGVPLDSETSEGANYVHAIHVITQMALERSMSPWKYWDLFYFNTENGRQCRAACNTAHAFTERVIGERRREWQTILLSDEMMESRSSSSPEHKTNSFETLIESESFREARKRLAFLDLMLHEHLINKSLTLEDVREEVDTFMFAGYDTTANSLSWAIYMLGLHPEVQQKCRLELDQLLGGPDELREEWNVADVITSSILDASLTTEHLARMKYLEQVIKETLRMMPTVPSVGRSVTEDIRIDDKYVIPKGAAITIPTQILHTNPDHWPQPERFDPDRFSPENSLHRHPYAFIPFSAGPRNCVGQKFAMMEMKCVLAKLVRNYQIEARRPLDRLRLVGELVLKCDTPLEVRFSARV